MPIIRSGDMKDGRFPEGFLFTLWGLARFKSGEACDYHYHDCDEYWFIVEGRAMVLEDGVEYEVGPGDCVFTPMGMEHKITAITDCAEFWAELQLRGEKRTGHLHRATEQEGN
ncbi:MAG: cupin domain-containing protein [Planctomycetia bacterium]|nr:cupin domain-containing protein [Planctomycetia bacterium]